MLLSVLSATYLFHFATGKSWEWQADDGTWQPFEPAEQMRLENAVQMGQKTVTFVDSIHFMQTVDLTCMEMINMKSGQAKNIRRSPVLHYSIKQPVKCLCFLL